VKFNFLKMIKSRIQSLRFALNGILFCIRNEVNFRLQLFAAAAVVAAGFTASVSAGEWLCICLCIAAVLAAEAFNTAIEKLCNLYSTDYNPHIKIIKDVAAGAVLLVAFGSLIAGSIIFLPRIYSYCKNFF
jgi:diacylglycerol kinase (ATP)